jgi:streptomycin 6-kinase
VHQKGSDPGWCGAVPDDLRRAVHYDLGAGAAQRWLDRLPGTIAAHAARWGLELDRMLPGGRLSACVAGHDRDGRDVVMKVPTSPGAGRLEVRGLRAWSACQVPQVYRADGRTGVFAMERIVPGTPHAGDDAEAVATALRSLHAAGAGEADAGGFPPLRASLMDRLRRAEQRCALPGNRIGRELHARAAAELERQQADETPRQGLLHGDFQAKNLLAGAGGAVRVIDPLPCLGDPAFDAATWCVLTLSAAPVGARVDRIARALDSDAAPIAEWAALLCALEYRPYRPEQAERLRAYAGG